MRTTATVAASLLALLIAPLAAGQPGKVFDGKDLTEAALVEALTPPPRARSIRVQRDQAAPAAPAAHLLITFETDSYDLTSDAKAALDKVGRALQTHPLTEFGFTVEGHADPRGTPDHNQRLSLARAESVLRYLVAQHGVSEKRLRAVGKGAAEPLNRAVEAAPENRRVTLITLQE